MTEAIENGDSAIANDSLLNIPQKQYKFKCIRCTTDYTQLDDLKHHYFDLHIGCDVNEHNTTTTTDQATNTPNRKRKLKDEPKPSSSKKSKPSETISSAKPQDDFKSDLMNKINFLNDDDEIKLFNLKNFDEKHLCDNLNKYENFKKRSLLQPGTIVWSAWHHIMWPAVIKKTSKDRNGGSLKIHIRHYEMGTARLGAHVFKMDPSRVELFLKCKHHADYKVLGATDKRLRKEFFIAYTLALEDFLQTQKTNDLNATEIEQQAVTSTPMPNKRKSCGKESGKTPQQHKHSVHGKMMSLEEIENITRQVSSQELIKENEKRKAYSNDLMKRLLSDQCRDYLISITNESTKCQRHTQYLSVDARERRKMRFSCCGPLIEDHQLELAKYLNQLSADSYKEKPAHLNSYEYDVLYPEAVIWSIMEMEALTYKKAELKFKQGFKLTQEELVKNKCHEIVNKLLNAKQKPQSQPKDTQTKVELVYNPDIHGSDDEDASLPLIGEYVVQKDVNNTI